MAREVENPDTKEVDFEGGRPVQETGETCPHCGEPPGRATFSTAPGQLVCANPDCPVNSWNVDP